MVPDGDMAGEHGDGGTSAAAPFWASLIVQFNAIFADQELPQLGYMNDLLYMASAIAPAAFNDVTLGNNMSSFSLGGANHLTRRHVNDHADRLRLLWPGRATTCDRAGHAQRPAAGARADERSPIRRYRSPASRHARCRRRQRLDERHRPEPAVPGHVGRRRDGGLEPRRRRPAFTSVAAGTFAWTNRVAQQSMQSDFDPNLVRLFDK